VEQKGASKLAVEGN